MRVRGSILTVAMAGLLAPVATPAHAQDGFLFSQPEVQLTLRAGPALHRASSDLFTEMTERLTLDRSDFRAPAVGGEFAVAVHPHVDISLGLAWSSSENRSEFRNWIGEDDQPIEQTTRLRTIPLSLSARVYPLSRGHAVSSLAWVPAQVTPYVGGGVDMTWHRLSQEGEFVDTETFDIFYDEYQTSGRSMGAHVRAGLDYWVTPRLAVNLDGRYMMGSASPDGDYITYDALDLSGFHAGIGLSLRW